MLFQNGANPRAGSVGPATKVEQNQMNGAEAFVPFAAQLKRKATVQQSGHEAGKSFGHVAEQVLLMPKPVRVCPTKVLARSVPKPQVLPPSIFLEPPKLKEVKEPEPATEKKISGILFLKEPVDSIPPLYCECCSLQSDDSFSSSSSSSSPTSRSPNHYSGYHSTLTAALVAHRKIDPKCDSCGLDPRPKPHPTNCGDLPATKDPKQKCDHVSRKSSFDASFFTDDRKIENDYFDHKEDTSPKHFVQELHEWVDLNSTEKSVDPHFYLKSFEDIYSMVKNMRSAKTGVSLSSRKCAHKCYQNVFSGSACVRWMLSNLRSKKTGMFSRRSWGNELIESISATRLGQTLIDLQLIHRIDIVGSNKRDRTQKTKFDATRKSYYQFLDEPPVKYPMNSVKPQTKNTCSSPNRSQSSSSMPYRKLSRSAPRTMSASWHRSPFNLPNNTNSTRYHQPEQTSNAYSDVKDDACSSTSDDSQNPVAMSIAALKKIKRLFNRVGRNGDPRSIPNLHGENFLDFREDVNALSAGLNILYLPHDDQAAFWINVYNCLRMHAYVVFGELPAEQDRTMFARKITYTIDGLEFSLLDIKYGILRSFMPIPDDQFFFPPRLNDPNDARSHYRLESNEKVIFALCSGEISSPACCAFSGKNLELQLEQVAQNFVQQRVGIRIEVDGHSTPSRHQQNGSANMAMGTTLRGKLHITIPYLFVRYRDDFGTTEQKLLQYISQYLGDIAGSLVSDFAAASACNVSFLKNDSRYNHRLYCGFS